MSQAPSPIISGGNGGIASSPLSVSSPLDGKVKLTPQDFDFGRLLGEGSFARVIQTLNETNDGYRVVSYIWI